MRTPESWGRSLVAMLADKLRARIRAEGPMPFEDYMAACLYDEEFGFFTTGPLRSVKDGDFLTSPEVSPWFGRMLARFVSQEQARTGADPFLVVEVGAGSGSLMKPLVEALRHVPPAEGRGDAERSDAGGILSSSSPSGGVALPRRSRTSGDRSPTPRSNGRSGPDGHNDPEKPPESSSGSLSESDNTDRRKPLLTSRLAGRSGAGKATPPSGGGAAPSEAEGVKAIHSPTYEFHAVEASPAARAALSGFLDPKNVHASLDDLPDSFNGIIIANELLDNLPCALAVRSGDGWVERWVGATDDRFGFVTAPARSEVAEWCDAYAGAVPEGGMVEAQLIAAEWVESALQHLNRGALALIDYGGTAEELEPRRTQGTLRTYRSHHLGPDPFLEPGATDVTVDVNFTAILAAAESVGATAELHRQDDFLVALGLWDNIREFKHQERDLTRSGEAMQRFIVRSEATDAETLLHPRGLGDFRVVVAKRSGGLEGT